MSSLLGIAIAPKKRAPMSETDSVIIGINEGIQGDARGTRRDRQVTVLFREGWDQACEELGAKLPWTTRRANLFVEGIPVPREGARLQIGDCILEVTQETQPCSVMEAAFSGLKAALSPNWRGGVCCKVVLGGIIRANDPVNLI
jgi:MOSC domain-containing protein YiiM